MLGEDICSIPQAVRDRLATTVATGEAQPPDAGLATRDRGAVVSVRRSRVQLAGGGQPRHAPFPSGSSRWYAGIGDQRSCYGY